MDEDELKWVANMSLLLKQFQDNFRSKTAWCRESSHFSEMDHALIHRDPANTTRWNNDVLMLAQHGEETFFVSFKPPRPRTEPRTLAWKAAVLTTTLGPPPLSKESYLLKLNVPANITAPKTPRRMWYLDIGLVPLLLPRPWLAKFLLDLPFHPFNFESK